MSSREPLTRAEKQELKELLEIVELKRLVKQLKQKKKQPRKPQNKTSSKKGKPKYVNELQKNIAKQFDINIPKPAPKSISKSYGK